MTQGAGESHSAGQLGSKGVSACARAIAAGFLPRMRLPMPGTIGSGVALLVWWLLHVSAGLHGVRDEILLSVVVCIVGWGATRSALRSLRPMVSEGKGSANGAREDQDDEEHKDPQWIVIDEWAGMWIALIGANPHSTMEVGAAFLLFRVFDMTKLGPIGWAERLPAVWGIMADDIVAGVCALVVRLAILSSV